MEVLAHLQSGRWNAVDDRPIPEHRQVEAVAVEGDKLRLQPTDLLYEVSDQLSLGSLPRMGLKPNPTLSGLET